MAELGFSVVDVAPARFAAAPELTARLRLTESTGVRVHTVALRAQVRIEAQQRRYAEAETAGLRDQFGALERWSSTLKPFVWMHCAAMVPGFAGSTEVDLPMPVTFDFEVTAAKYLHALSDGDVPLSFLFSGTVFTRGGNGFAVERIPWSAEAPYRMPVSVWDEAMAEFFPAAGWIRLPHDTLAELAGYKAARGLTSWESVVDSLLCGARQGAP